MKRDLIFPWLVLILNMNDCGSEILEIIKEFESVKKRYNPWKECFFSLISDLYGYPVKHLGRSSIQTAVFYAFNCYTIVILASSICNRGLPINSWANYDNLWLFLELSRIDVICAELTILNSCITATFAYYLAIITIFFLAFFLNFFFKSHFKILVSPLKVLLIIAAVGNLPFFVLLSLTFKYSSTNSTPAENQDTATELDLSGPGVVLSLLVLVFLSGIGYCGAVFDYDFRHSHSQSSLSAKAYSKIELFSLICNYCSFLLFAFYASSNFISYRIALICMHGGIAMMYRKHLPYYNLSANFIRSSCHIIVCCLSAITIVAYAIDSAVFCIYAVCMILPLVMYLWHAVLIHRVSTIQDNQVEQIEDIWEFELIMRKEMKDSDGNKAKEIFEKFNEFYTKNTCKKYKILLLWEVSFCFYGFGNSELAFFKLSQDDCIENSLEEDYQEYLLRKTISDIILKENNEYTYLLKLYKYEKVKRIDKQACILALQYWNHINSKKTDLSMIEDNGKKLKAALDALKRKYSKLAIQFPESMMILEIYRTFLTSFYNDQDAGSVLKAQQQSLLKVRELDNSRGNSMFNEEYPLFLVSASTSTIGNIVFANSAMCDLLKSCLINFTNIPISSYFPEVFSFFHAPDLEKFKTNAYDSMKYIEKDIVLIDEKKSLIEASVTVILFGSISPLYMFICRPIETVRGTALISKEGVILYHSENLISILAVNFEIRGRCICEIIDLQLKTLKRRSIMSITTSHINIIVEYKSITIRSKKIRFLYVYSNEIHGNEQEDFDRIQITTDNFRRVSFQIQSPRHVSIAHTDNTNKLNPESEMERKIHMTNSSGLVINPLLRRMSMYSDQSIQTLKFFKIVLFISVNYI